MRFRHTRMHAHAHVSASLKSLFTFSWKLEKYRVTSNLLRGPLRRPLSKDLFFVRPRIFLIYESLGQRYVYGCVSATVLQFRRGAHC